MTTTTTTTTRWPLAVIGIHWLAAGLVGSLAVAGFVMTDLPADSDTRLLLSRLHSLGGVSLMLLTLARLVVRRRGPAPAPLPLTDGHRRGVGLVHAGIYAALFGLGATGFLTGATSDWPLYLQGQRTTVPALESLVVRELHEVFVAMLIGLTALHVAGVLVQQLKGNLVLRRMLP